MPADSADSSWEITEPRTLDFEGPFAELHVRIVNGAVNVVGTEDPGARVEIAEVSGPPLRVRRTGGVLEIDYEDVPWKGFLKWLDRKGWQRRAVVSVSVPAGVRLTVGVVGADAVVSGIAGRTEVRGVWGGTTLVGLTGAVRADTVSGDVETQGLAGGMRFNSVSGGLTMIDTVGSQVRADSVSGSMVLDLAPGGGPDVVLSTVSGEIAVRLPEPTDARVQVNTASGAVSTAFDGLGSAGQWGAWRLSGKLGTGRGRVKADTVSGSVALLRRPPDPDETGDAMDGSTGEPADGARGGVPDDVPEDAPSFSKDV
ncbi:hypothetical protein [Streptomyces sp. ODS28]|uniref:DUF4097 family beta strand repeat-containing protein n=1 Tax=Streptomyces sp. ODS28 TaxID=3136688 RepID=UPI0031E96CF9